MGSTVWIIEQNNVNRTALARIPSVEKHLASLVGLSMVQDKLAA
jgi:glutamate synthase (NADPH/NADH) large chain